VPREVGDVGPGSAAEIGDFELRELTLRLMRGENLSGAEAANFLGCLLNPIATDEQIAAALVSLAVKGETFEELAGIAEAMRNRALPLRSRHKRFIDTAGTGSSAAKTFNISTAAAFVIAGADLPVAKHGSRAATSRCGSADVLEALGADRSAFLAFSGRAVSLVAPRAAGPPFPAIGVARKA
jgi:anthranilate phosphoribosyltransferase